MKLSEVIAQGPAAATNLGDGLLAPGNIDVHARPVVHNRDGTISTVRSIGVGTDLGEVVIPTISDDGLALTDEEAIALYRGSGRNLGTFDTPEHATQFARHLHDQQAREYGGSVRLSEVAPGETHRVTDDMAQELAQANPSASPLLLRLGNIAEQTKLGYGRGVAELGQGAKQLALHAGGALGLTDPATVSDYDRRVADEAELYRNDLGQTGGGQLGDLLGQAVTTLPLGAAGKTAGVLASAGRTALQGAAINTLQPVTDVKAPPSLSTLVSEAPSGGEDYLSSKFGQAATGALLGAGGNLALRGLGAGVMAARNLPSLPMRIKAGKDVVAASQGDVLPATPSGDFIADSQALSRETGVPFTPGQQTGSKGLTTAEQKVRQSQKTADAAFAVDKAATQALDDYVTRAMRNIAKNGASPEQTGELVRNALGKKAAALESARSTQAATDYGAVRELTKGAATIEPSASNDLLNQIVAEYDGVGSPSADALARFAKRQLANIDPKAKAAAQAAANPDAAQQVMNRFAPPEQMPSEILGKAAATAPAQGNLDKLVQLRSYLSKVAGGQAKISGDNVDRRLAAQLLGAIDTDMATAEGVGGQVGAALKTANANYRTASQQIEYLQRSPLGRLLGEVVTDGGGSAFNTVAPEKLIARVQKMTPSEVGITRALMQQQSGGSEFSGSLADAWQQMKRTLLESALDTARAAAPSKGANPLALQPAALVKALGQHSPQGQAWARAVFEPNELNQIQNAAKAAQRLGDMTGYNFSGTAPALEQGLGEIAASAAMGSKVGAARRVAGMASEFFASKRLAAAMADPDGRRALLQLQRLPPGSAKARELTAYLATLVPGTDEPDQAQNSAQEP